MEASLLSAEVTEQFDRGFRMLSDLVERFSDEQWRGQGGSDQKAPCRWAYHAVQANDFYVGDSPDGFNWHAVQDWEDAAEMLPSKAELLEYAAGVKEKLHDVWDARTDAEMKEPTKFPWTGHTRSGQLLYCLRHFLYHLGELSMVSREIGHPESPWS